MGPSGPGKSLGNAAPKNKQKQTKTIISQTRNRILHSIRIIVRYSAIYVTHQTEGAEAFRVRGVTH